MRRFRILFLVVAVALLVPMTLLVHRALDSVEVERRVRHEAVAERLFDEMERVLSELLRREEERPFGHYAFEYTPPGETPGIRLRSPLAELPELPFVIGYFQIDPDETVRSPLRPRETGHDDWRVSSRESAAIATVERLTGSWFRSDRGQAKARSAAVSQVPGSTVELERAGAAAPQALAQAERKSERGVSAYDALRALNKGVEQRAERQAKITEEYAPRARASSGDRQAPAARAMLEADAAAPPLQDEPQSRRSNEVMRFELSPMIGRRIDGGHVILYRTAVHENQVYRQGLLLEVGRLGEWLREQTVGASDLAPYATVGLAVPDSSSSLDPSRLVYQHRFAAPFEELTARLDLKPLPGMGGAAYVYALSALLLVAATLGLAAIYRMVSMTVRFAEQRSNFVAAVTHELRTPLTAIRMYGEMLRDGIVPSESKRDEYHRRITAESERLTRLVNNVLEFSRLEKRTRRAHAEAGPVGPIVQEVAELVRPHVEEAGFRLRVDLEPDLPPVRFERDALKQVLFNLVDNSVKYANGAAVKEITLRCRRSADGFALAVSDNGPGVSAAHIDRIFDPFYREENELTRRTKGTGLGLALVRGLLEEMGARVTGRNVPEGGFEVEILFRSAS